jgi:hypothetical protein
MQARAMRREFSFLGIRLPDPDSTRRRIDRKADIVVGGLQGDRS